jgi:LAS superfamily LD-carboxypeptidase LdcB
MKENNKIQNPKFWLIAGFLVLTLIGLGVESYLYYQNLKNLESIKIELTNTKSDLTQITDRAKILADELEQEKNKNALFGGQIQEIVGTVGTLDKLAKTDKELLQKYSKVYFLNEHYVPDSLTNIPPDYIYEKSKVVKVHSQVFPYLQEMVSAGAKEGLELKIISGYRSFGEQGSLKNSYNFVYGNGANQFSADQGYSEHQLGTTVDFTNSKLGTSFNAFAKSAEYDWLQKNAYKYGFVLSYPAGNSYYQFEPWHWRFVGKKLAMMLHEEKENFYDLSQNKIDAYLLNIFD